MNVTISQIPKNWNPENSMAFANWFKMHVKSPLEIKEDYYLTKTL